MKVQLKVKKDRYKWVDVDLKELIHKSVVDYLSDEFDPAMAAITDDNGKAELIVANCEDLREHYKKEGVLYFLADEMKELLGTHVGPELVIHTFEGSTLFEIKTLKPEKE